MPCSPRTNCWRSLTSQRTRAPCRPPCPSSTWTIGFLSQLPHSLIESSATLQDVTHSDVTLHVGDESHPKVELQKASVLTALHSLGPPAPMQDLVLEAPSGPGARVPPIRAVCPGVSALRGLGLEELKAELQVTMLSAREAHGDPPCAAGRTAAQLAARGGHGAEHAGGP